MNGAKITPLSGRLLSPVRGELSPKRKAEIPFAGHLQEALKHSDRLQKEADRAAESLLSGDLDSLHHLMIATEQAQLSLQLTVQVVNKAVQAYQEIYRMQV